ncbi:hypothetical protein CICLE_v10033540mg, partial [Citrus x clementina]
MDLRRSFIIFSLISTIIPGMTLAEEFIVGDEIGWTTGFYYSVLRPCVSESDTIVLETPGRKWYICGVGKHCENGGQKLVITVQPAPSIAPSLL